MRDISVTSERALVNEGVASTFYIILTQGALLTAMGLFFGLDAVWIGITASFPLAFQVVQVLNPWLLARVKSRKRVLAVANAGRFLWILLMVAMLRERQSPMLFVIVFAFTQMTNAVAANTWMSLVRDVVAVERQGSFVARRNSFIAVITVVLVFFYSWLIDVVPSPFNWTFVLIISFVGTILSLVFIAPIREPEYTGAGFPGTWAVILADRNFMRLCFSFFVWNGVILISAPFFSYHQIANLRLPMTVIGVATISTSLLSILFFRLWASVSDRMGTKTILVAGIALASITPSVWLFMTEQYWPYAMVVDALLAALAWSALNIAFIALPLEVAKDGSPGYFALFFAFGGIGGLIGSVIGGFASAWLGQFSVEVAGQTIFGIQFMFPAVSVLRFSTIVLFAGVYTQRYVPPHTMIMNVLSIIGRRSPLRVFESLRLDFRPRERRRFPRGTAKDRR
jgi:MFS family permease